MAAAQSTHDKPDARRSGASEVDDDDAVESGTTGAASLPTAVVVPKGEDTVPPDPARWLRRGIFLGALVLGWLFILYFNRFNFSAPTVFVCLAYLAVVSTGYALWRTGVVVVAEEVDDADSTWGRPLGRRSELDREKKTLLKAIKEAEFDREMGKLSKADADEMIAVYRVRAIEVIKEIDQMDAGAAGTVREQIERELKARLEVDAKADKLKADAQADATKDKKKKEAAAKKTAKPAGKEPAKSEPSKGVDAKADDAAKSDDASKIDASTTTDASTGGDDPATSDAATKNDTNSDSVKEATS